MSTKAYQRFMDISTSVLLIGSTLVMMGIIARIFAY